MSSIQRRAAIVPLSVLCGILLMLHERPAAEPIQPTPEHAPAAAAPQAVRSAVPADRPSTAAKDSPWREDQVMVRLTEATSAHDLAATYGTEAIRTSPRGMAASAVPAQMDRRDFLRLLSADDRVVESATV